MYTTHFNLNHPTSLSPISDRPSQNTHSYPFYLFLKVFIFICINISPGCMSVQHMLAYCQRRIEHGIGPLEQELYMVLKCHLCDRI